MSRYGPLFCVVLLLVSAFYFQRTKRVHIIHQLSGGIFFISSLLMLITFYDVSLNGSYQNSFILGQLFGFKMINSLSVLVILVFYMTITMIIWFSNYSLRKYIEPSLIPDYYSLMHLMNAAITVIIFTEFFITTYLAYVVLITSAYHMIQIKNQDALPYEKKKFLVLNLFGLFLLFIGLFMMIMKSHAFGFGSFNQYIESHLYQDRNYFTLSLTLCIIGLGVNGVLFPFYEWMPDLFATTPAPLSAQLSAVTIKISPIVMMKLLLTGYGVENYEMLHMSYVLIVLGIASMISGSLFAMLQKDLKKLIAFSTISQLGYIYLAVGLGNIYGIRIALYQLLAHTVTKSAMYLSVGSIYEQLGTTNISAMKGIGKHLPITLGCFSLGALSMVGIPVLPGFITKWNLSLASLERGSIFPLVAILISAILNAIYYLPIITSGFFGQGDINYRQFTSKAKPIREVIPLMILISTVIFMGFFANTLFQYINASEMMATLFIYLGGLS